MKLAKLIDDSELSKTLTALTSKDIKSATVQAEAKIKEQTFRRSLTQIWRNEHRTLIRRLSVATAVSITLSLLSQGKAEAITFTKIADINTVIPGGNGNFSPGSFPFERAFSPPSIDGDNVAFIGYGSNSQQGIYISKEGVLNVVADTNTVILDGNGNFNFFGALSLNGDNIAFNGSRFDPNTFSILEDRIYISQGDELNAVADTNTAIPDGIGNFTFLFSPSLDGDNIAFNGGRFDPNTFETLEDGIYISKGDELDAVADTNTAIPGGSGNFSNFLRLSLDGDQVAFSGFDNILRPGIYISQGDELDVVADTNTAIPDGIGNFTFVFSPSLDDGVVAFLGSGIFEEGIYTREKGMLKVVANSNTLVPGSDVNFCDFGSDFSLNNGSVVFLGGIGDVGGGGCDLVIRDSDFGIYTNLGGSLKKIIDSNDVLDGKTIVNLSVGDEAFSGNAIAFYARFSDGSEGIFRADLSATSVPEPASALGLLAVGALGTVFRHKRS